MFVYLAGPIDNVSVDEGQRWREAAAEIFGRYAIGTYSPAHAFQNLERSVHAEIVEKINKHVIYYSDFVFAFIRDGAFGTIREVEHARALNKNVYLWSNEDFAYEKLERSYSTIDCYTTDEKFLGDAIRWAVNHWKLDQEEQNAEAAHV